VENVQSSDCFWSSLFIAKYKINPLMQLARNKFTLQGLKWVKKEMRVCPNLAAPCFCITMKYSRQIRTCSLHSSIWFLWSTYSVLRNCKIQCLIRQRSKMKNFSF
jgi:hypothetical protein